MSENINPLLFSASASIFDNITGSSAVLLPPQAQNVDSNSGPQRDTDKAAKSSNVEGRPVPSVDNSDLTTKFQPLSMRDLAATSAVPSYISQGNAFGSSSSIPPATYGVGVAPPAPLPASIGASITEPFSGVRTTELPSAPASLLHDGVDERRLYMTSSVAASSLENASRSTTPGTSSSISTSFNSELPASSTSAASLPPGHSATLPELSSFQSSQFGKPVPLPTGNVPSLPLLSNSNSAQMSPGGFPVAPQHSSIPPLSFPYSTATQSFPNIVPTSSRPTQPLLPTMPTQPPALQTTQPMLSTLPTAQPLLPSVSTQPSPMNQLAHGFPYFSPTPPLPNTLPVQGALSSQSERDGIGAQSLHSAHSNAPNTWSPPVFGESPEQQESPLLPPSFESMASSGSSPVARYRLINPHWFYGVPDKPAEWKPFSFTDTINLEEAYRNGGCGVVSTDGGRYDVEVSSRVRRPVYWGTGSEGSSDHTTPVRRCSWFRKGSSDLAPVPYEEAVADKLEDAFRECVEIDAWGRQVEVSGEAPGVVMLSSPHAMHHYSTSLSTAFPTSVSIAESQAPDVVKRGADDFSVADGECDQVDHLVFLVHGIGPVCDLSFRSVEQCVDSFRELGGELLGSHFRQSVESGRVGRVEVLPVSWHKALHSDTDGIDQRLKPITLRSIPMLREFTNDTIVDVLLYTSPAYCQLIVDTVAGEINRMYKVFRERNPNFTGGTSVAGHSLGSVILFDLLMHQRSEVQEQESEVGSTVHTEGGVGVEMLQQKGVGSVLTASDMRAKKRAQPSSQECRQSVHFELGPAGTGQPSIVYPQLLFSPQAAFLLGSPIAMFLTVRGLTQLSPQYKLPTCPHVFNIFHPYDPVAYRLETLIYPDLTSLRPVLVPHHKGRKRMHLELKDTLERVGSDIKHKIVDSLQATWNKLYTLYSGTTQQQIEQAEQEQLSRLGMEEEEDIPATVGQLNAGRRIDYVLQEKPYESFTEYIFALQAHLSYWKSEDTLLLMLKEIYGFMGISCDAKVNPSVAAAPATTSPTYMLSSPASPPYPLPNAAASRAAPAVPVPLLPSVGSSSDAAPIMLPPPLPGSAAPPRVLGGRPVVDISAVPQRPGMDPTAEPQATAVPPPPAGTGLTFTRIKGGRRR